MYDYNEACPLSMAASVLCERWTLQIARGYEEGDLIDDTTLAGAPAMLEVVSRGAGALTF